jgi:outer membrane protein
MKRISIVAVLVSTCFALSAARVWAQGAQSNAQAPAGQAPAAPAQAPAAPPEQQPPPAPPPFPAGAKIAFVNMQLVVAQSKLGQAGQTRMKALYDEHQAKLAELARGIQDQQQKITTQTGVVSDSALQQMRRDLERMQLEAQAEQQRAQTDEQNLNEDLLTDFSQKAMPVIEALRVERDLWVVLGVSDSVEGGGQLMIASAHPGLDLSLEVIKRLDEQFATSGQ